MKRMERPPLRPRAPSTAWASSAVSGHILTHMAASVLDQCLYSKVL